MNQILSRDARPTEQVKLLVVGTVYLNDESGTVKKDEHHWIELDVPLFGSPALFDVEQKAKNIYEEISPSLIQFRVEYLWQSELHWQSEPIRPIPNSRSLRKYIILILVCFVTPALHQSS